MTSCLTLNKIGPWTHSHFHLEFHGDQIIFGQVSVGGAKPHNLNELQPHEFLNLTLTYSVHWSETSAEPFRRDRHHGDGSCFFPGYGNPLSIISSMVLVLLLVDFVAVILMPVFKYPGLPANLTEEATSGGSGDDFDQGDKGWEIIHTDVFCFLHPEVCCMLILGWVPSSWPCTGEGIQPIRDFSQGVEVSKWFVQ